MLTKWINKKNWSKQAHQVNGGRESPAITKRRCVGSDRATATFNVLGGVGIGRCVCFVAGSHFHMRAAFTRGSKLSLIGVRAFRCYFSSRIFWSREIVDRVHSLPRLSIINSLSSKIPFEYLTENKSFSSARVCQNFSTFFLPLLTPPRTFECATIYRICTKTNLRDIADRERKREREGERSLTVNEAKRIILYRVHVNESLGAVSR